MNTPDPGWGGPDPGWGGRTNGGNGEDHKTGKVKTYDEKQRSKGKDQRSKQSKDRSTKIKSASVSKTLRTWTDDDVLDFGLSLVGFGTKRQKVRPEQNTKRFRAHYGVGPKAIAALLKDLSPPEPDKSWSKKYVKKLLMGVCWLKLYETEEVMAGRWDCGEETCRNTVKKYTSQIQSLKPLKITFDGMDPKLKWLFIDGVHFITEEMRTDPDSKWWSHKSNGPGFAYEVVLDTVEYVARWTNGPKPAGVHDLTFLRGGTVKMGKKNWDRSALYWNIPRGVRLCGDSGYTGQDDLVSTTDDAHGKDTKELFARFKSRQETYNARLKSFGVLSQKFRHGKNGLQSKLDLHQTCFDSITVLVAYDMENGHPLFEV